MIDTLYFFEELKQTLDPPAAKKIVELMAKMYEELSNMVTKAEFNELRKVVGELVEAQKRTEQRVNELAEAQKQTEKEIKALAKGLKETRQMVGNLSDTVGYTLEDRAIKNLPEILEKEYGIRVKQGLLRKYVKYNGKSDELNIYGIGIKDEKEVYIVGEAKARLSKKHVDRLLKMVSRLEKHGVIGREKFLVLITYTSIPEAEEYAKSKGVEVIWSYRV